MEDGRGGREPGGPRASEAALSAPEWPAEGLGRPPRARVLPDALSTSPLREPGRRSRGRGGPSGPGVPRLVSALPRRGDRPARAEEEGKNPLGAPTAS